MPPVLPEEPVAQTQPFFAQADDSKVLTGDPNEQVGRLLTDVGPEFAKGLGLNLKIEDWMIEEIKLFTDELVADCATEREKLDAIYAFVGDEVEYVHQGYVDNDPYAVFTERKAICQGFANLLKVMCYTQDIPALVANGNLIYNGMFYGAHAWNYVCADGKWYVCDPTNKATMGGGPYGIRAFSSYSHLVVSYLDAILFEDDGFTYVYNENMINVNSIKGGKEQVVVPYSTNGYKVTSFNPTTMFPDEVRELVIGANIEYMGREEYIIGINHYANKVESIQIDPESNYFTSFHNVVYKKTDGYLTLLAIAPGVKEIELKPLVVFDKDNAIKYHDNLESVVFVPGTQSINDYAVEFCPKLHTAYIPVDTEVSENAFDGVASDFEIIRGDYTNIPQIKMD